MGEIEKKYLKTGEEIRKIKFLTARKK